MNLKVFLHISALILCISVVLGQNEMLHCNYGNVNYNYSCRLEIYNPRGLNNFYTINGTHSSGQYDSKVKTITRYTTSSTWNSPIVPSILCNKFTNLERMELSALGVKNILYFEIEDPLEKCHYLKYLDLSYNSINEILLGSFNSLNNLQTLDLRRNNISSLHEQSFISLFNLITLYLEYNKIKEIPQHAFKSLIKVRTLYLNNNEINMLRAQSFINMISLITLHLKYNKIEEIQPYTFESLGNLGTLYLNNNNISILHAQSFISLVNLTTLYLQNNAIEEIPGNTFESLENLIELNLQYNKINNLNSGLFSSLQSLNALHLYNNSLEVIYSNSFGTLPNLKTVRFDYNKINAIDRKFVTDTGVISLNMIKNICANETIYDNSVWRFSMQIILSICIDNFEVYVTEPTTIPITSTTISTTQSTEQETTTEPSTPPKCSGENLDERVCDIEDEIEILNNRDKTFAAAIEELQNKVNELTNRPCACS